MLDPILTALDTLFSLHRLLALFAGMFAGIIFGMLPGLGGVAAVSILLPFVYFMDSYAGLSMLLGAVSVVYTADTITSVLIGAPGSPASAPTAIEGHALAKQGHAAQALGVGFLASLVGGLVGAVTLALAIPVAGPIVLLLGTPELFMFALVGLYFASSMIGKDIAKGLAAACFGLLLGVVGPAPAAADFRFTFGQTYLLDGFSLTVVALGLFGIAELVSMLASGGGISNEKTLLNRWSDSVSEFWRHRFLILRSAIIGVFGGFIPAVGASASTWVAYAHSMKSATDKSKFGNGDIRGVAAAEGANNATIISDLVPTLLFSVPGGPAAAIFLGALFSFGYYPGPRMVTENPDLLFFIVWSVALASIVGAIVCFLITPMISKLTRIPFAIIAAPLLLVMVLGAYQATNTMGDIFMLLCLGVVGWLMKHAQWPRAPVLVGFVLAGPMEQYFWLSNQLHGWSWLLRPGVLIIASIIIIPMLVKAGKRLRTRTDSTRYHLPLPDVRARPENRSVSVILATIMVVVFAYAVWELQGFNTDSKLLPTLAIIPGFIFSAITCYKGFRLYSDDSDSEAQKFTEHYYLVPLITYVAAIWAIGFILPTIVVIAWMLFFCARMRWYTGLGYGAVVFAAILVLFRLINSTPPTGVLITLF